MEGSFRERQMSIISEGFKGARTQRRRGGGWASFFWGGGGELSPTRDAFLTTGRSEGESKNVANTAETNT